MRRTWSPSTTKLSSTDGPTLELSTRKRGELESVKNSIVKEIHGITGGALDSHEARPVRLICKVQERTP
jgi:hypothetical protein